MTNFRKAAEDYLAMRRSLGVKLERFGQLLLQFVSHLEAAGAEHLTRAEAFAWATAPVGADPAWWGVRLGIARIFATHLRVLDPSTEVPPPGLLPERSPRATPYLYSADDIAALMVAARGMCSRVKAATYETLIGLLATTGMRIGEAIRLDRGDLDTEEGVLLVRDTKFGKSREVPLHPSTLEALSTYLALVDRLRPQRPTPALLVSTTGRRLDYDYVHRSFHALVTGLGLPAHSARHRPRIHDLRHTFAVLSWYRSGVDVQAHLPLLSTYLGHVDPADTYWYLSASPELLALAARRLEATLGELP